VTGHRCGIHRWRVGGSNLPGLAQGAFARGSRDGRAARRVCGLAALHVRRLCGPPWSCMRGNECVSRRRVSKRGFNVSM
jgi:hypothetical protein